MPTSRKDSASFVREYPAARLVRTVDIFNSEDVDRFTLSSNSFVAFPAFVNASLASFAARSEASPNFRMETEPLSSTTICILSFSSVIFFGLGGLPVFFQERLLQGFQFEGQSPVHPYAQDPGNFIKGREINSRDTAETEPQLGSGNAPQLPRFFILRQKSRRRAGAGSAGRRFREAAVPAPPLVMLFPAGLAVVRPVAGEPPPDLGQFFTSSSRAVSAASARDMASSMIQAEKLIILSATRSLFSSVQGAAWPSGSTIPSQSSTT